MDPLASQDTTNAPGAVSDQMIQAENDQVEQQEQAHPQATGAFFRIGAVLSA